MIKYLSLCLGLLVAVQGIAVADILDENFDNVGALSGNGWAIVNRSAPVGATSWFQGNPGIFTSQSGSPDAYIAANFLNADASGGNISDWLITPVLTIRNGDVIRFSTRTEFPAILADRLEVRISTNGASTDVGGTDSSVGDFGTLLFAINPALDPSGYPDVWTEFSATVSGVSPGASGRYAFRYFVTDTSVNGDYIGIDSVSVVAAPEPATIFGLGLVVAALALRKKVS